MNTPDLIQLKSLAVLLVSGADARNFLQGQLTADLATLTRSNVMLAACNSPQGRVQAVLWLIERDDGIALLVERELLEQTLTRLRRYVLRAKVTFSADRLIAATGATRSESHVSHSQLGERSLVTLPGHSHALIVEPARASGREGSRNEAEGIDDSLWAQEHLRAGLPRIHTQTHEQFVAQMLNLDLLGGISFEKGCYTGQEIIARTHFRGAVKRRMLRFSASCAAPQPGTRVLAGDQHAGDVVDAIALDGGCELLAVIALAQLGETLTLDTNPDAELQRLSLPYEVPTVSAG